ncbi:MAG: NTP transferase domain-containing protein [Thermoanaerobaculia bacterium]|nr:MAG: NTP transferase domain-containing protein [Thermoanaerobaculia bacterium]
MPPVTPSALVLAGGSGTRFWPASRRARPKQLLALEGERSLLQATLDRLRPLVPPERIWVATTPELAPAVEAQVPELPRGHVLVEPAQRNTGPAIGAALHALPAEARAGVIAVLPSDHRVAERHDRVVALGVTPRWPETGFGYLELGGALAGDSGLRAVERFREKPDRATAEAFVASGRHLWNAGIFVFRGETLLAELARHAPGLAAGLELVAREPERAAERYRELPSISIDYAVMEKASGLAALPLDCGWDDLGSWQALFEVLEGDRDGNRRRGALVSVDARDNLVYAPSGTVALLGVEGLVVVATGDAVLVLPRERAQEVRRVVERLEAEDRPDLL